MLHIVYVHLYFNFPYEWAVIHDVKHFMYFNFPYEWVHAGMGSYTWIYSSLLKYSKGVSVHVSVLLQFAK